MMILDLAKIIYTPGTASEDTHITVIAHLSGNCLWRGKAKDMQNQQKLKGWNVVEMRVDGSVGQHIASAPDYNWGKIITVI